MRLSKVAIRNFKAIGELEVVIPKTDRSREGSADFISIVGENNSAKSSILEALLLTLPSTSLTSPTEYHFPGRDVANGPIEVELTFDELDDFDQVEQGIRTHVHDGIYRIKKVWEAPNASARIWAYQPLYNFPSWPETATNKQSLLDADDGWIAVVEEYEQRKGGELGRLGSNINEAIKEIAVELGSAVVEEGPVHWVENPGGFSPHVNSILPRPIFVPAIRETKEEVETGKAKSAARQIVQAMFDNQLMEHPAILQYQNAGADVQALFAEGEVNEIVQGVETRITNKLKRLIDLEVSLDFVPPDVTTDLAAKTFIEVIDDGFKTKPEHQGHGAQRALILSLLELLAEDAVPNQEGQGFQRNILLLIEEPEIYLHPAMCRKMRDVLLQIARSGVAQVFCTTHSAVFLDLADRHDGIVILQKIGGEVVPLQRNEDLFEGVDDEERQRLRMVLNFDASVNEVFFARRICLVEGDTERAALEAAAERFASDGEFNLDSYKVARRELVVVNCRGKWTIRPFQRVLNGFGLSYYVVHDADQEGDGGANAVILDLLTGDETRRLVHDPNFESVVFGEEWQSDKPWRARQWILDVEVVPEPLVQFFEFVLGKTREDLGNEHE